MARLVIRIRFAWWLSPWLHGLTFMCLLMQREPDWKKVNKMVESALRLTVD